MTRIPRSKRQPQETPTDIALPRQRFLAGGAIELRPVRHLRCPTCSLMARLELIVGGPYHPIARDQRYGGSPPKGSPETNRRGFQYSRGRIEWTEAMPCNREELDTLKVVLENALESVTEIIGRG